MKRIVFSTILSLTGLLMPVTVFAVDENSSWEEIFNSGYEFQIPRVWFGTFGIPASNVCIAGDELQTMDPVKSCIEYGHGNLNSTCLKYDYTKLARSRFYAQKNCQRYAAQHECVKWVIEEAEVPLLYLVPVYEAARWDDGRHDRPKKLAFQKKLVISACLEDRNF